MRVFSGIKPSGEMHIGNYFGAVRHWVAEQQIHDAIYCLVDYHAMTVPYDPEELLMRTRQLAALLLASGIDPEKAIFFVQSHVTEHAELAWVLNCVTTMGELSRQTQFKSKSDNQPSVSVGLFDYPVLMAADILLYDTDRVPVGDDQRQHVELARDVAIRFNQRFKPTFVVPEAILPTVGARIRDLQNPMAKMSKSDVSPMGTVVMLDTPEIIRKKIKAAVTDSETTVRYDVTEKPGVSNLIEMLSTLLGKPIPEIEAAYGSGGYGKFKSDVADALIETLRPIQEAYRRLESAPDELERLLARGAERAREIAAPKMRAVRDAAGLTHPRVRS